MDVTALLPPPLPSPAIASINGSSQHMNGHAPPHQNGNASLLPPPLPPTSAPTSVPGARRSTRACDACRRRKVRCNGSAPRCQQCAHLDILCQYSSTGSSKRSRKTAAPRGTVIAACRSASFGSATPPPPMQPARSVPLSPSKSSPGARTLVSDGSSPAGIWSPELSMRTPTFISHGLTAQFFLDLMPEYLTMVYPVNPIVPEWEIRDLITHMGTGDPDVMAFLYSFAAVTINLSSLERPDGKDQVSSLLQAAMDNSRRLTHLDPVPSAVRIVTSIFIEISLMGLGKVDLGQLYLREAIGMILLRRVHVPDVMAKTDRMERSRLERLYWECFIHERFSAVAHEEEVLMEPLDHMPEWDPARPYASWQIHEGWLCTIETFKMIDKDWVMYWLRRHAPPPEWVQSRYRELEDRRWDDRLAALLPMSQADIIVTRHWLRTTLWQIAIRNMVLSSDTDGSAPDEAPSLTLPLQLSKELKPFLESFSLEEVAVHGTGVVFKLFEITNAIIDVITQLPFAPNSDKRERLEDLLMLKDLILRFSKIEGMHRKILEQKFEKVRKLHAQACAEDAELHELVNLL